MAIKNNILTLIFILILFICSGVLNKNLVKPSFKVSKQSSALNISHELLSIFDLGQRRLFSDILWISTLLESDLEHYKENDLNSWLYLRFNTISVLDPLFLKNYQSITFMNNFKVFIPLGINSSTLNYCVVDKQSNH